MNGRTVLINNAEIGMSNWTLSSRVIKLEQCELLSVARTEHPSVPVQHILVERK